MAIHLTPTELGREAGMHRREVITKCMEHGVPIFQGRIDKTPRGWPRHSRAHRPKLLLHSLDSAGQRIPEGGAKWSASHP